MGGRGNPVAFFDSRINHMVKLPESTMPTVEAIYRAYEDDQNTDFRDHMGASSIGHDCDRHIWHRFRWSVRQHHPGRILRLFDTGNLAEARFVADLRRVGVQVMEIDPATGKQWQVRDATGHYGGSLDALAVGFVEAPKTVHVCEFKTHNDKSFKALKKEGVLASKPMHYAQMQSYMHLGGWTRAFYLAVNKDTDELYQERIHYDASFGMRMTARAQHIIAQQDIPIGISSDESHYKCRMCDYHGVCFSNKMPERHCRSCIFSTPIENGNWHCGKHEMLIDGEMQRKGCRWHRYIPSFITQKGWEQIDATINGEVITYKMISGDRTWIDEGVG